MSVIRRAGWWASALRLGVALCAVLTFGAAGPVAAEEPPFHACSQCHSDMSSTSCAAVISVAVATCCGQGGGWAWCVNSEWGTYVNCNGDIPPDCQCDDWGNNCDADFRFAD